MRCICAPHSLECRLQTKCRAHIRVQCWCCTFWMGLSLCRYMVTCSMLFNCNNRLVPTVQIYIWWHAQCCLIARMDFSAMSSFLNSSCDGICIQIHKNCEQTNVRVNYTLFKDINSNFSSSCCLSIWTGDQNHTIWMKLPWCSTRVL